MASLHSHHSISYSVRVINTLEGVSTSGLILWKNCRGTFLSPPTMSPLLCPPTVLFPSSQVHATGKCVAKNLSFLESFDLESHESLERLQKEERIAAKKRRRLIEDALFDQSAAVAVTRKKGTSSGGGTLGRERAGLSCIGPVSDRFQTSVRPVSDRFQTSFRPVPCRMHSPCHSVMSVAQSMLSCHVRCTVSCRICTCLDRNS